MTILHLADLHFGKVIHGVSMLDNGDQPWWVDRLIELVDEKHPDAVVIAGDVYDRAYPSGGAVQLLSRLLTALAERSIPVMIAAGNHDSAERLSFAGDILARQQVYISAPLTAPELTRVTLHDAYGPVHVYLMPYVFPALAAQAMDDESIRNYDAAVRRILQAQAIDTAQRNVLVAHQNVTAFGQEVQRGGSESMVGGVGQVDVSAFDGFDYVALGHIHAAYPVGRDTVRYAGSPLCYHFEETKQRTKGPLFVTLGEKGNVSWEVCPIAPLHPMREVRGSLEELRRGEMLGGGRGEYLRIVLEDQRVTPEAFDLFHTIAKARQSVLMELTSSYRQAWSDASAPEASALREKTVEELFADFFTDRCGVMPEEADMSLLHFAGEQMRHGEAQISEKDVDRLMDYLMKQEDDA